MKTFPRSDIDNADRFIEEHGQDVRYCSEWARWLSWDGSKWTIGAEAEVNCRAEETIKRLLLEARQIQDSLAREKAEKCALASQSNYRIKAMLSRVQHRLAAQPAEFDRELWLFNSVLGAVDLKTGKLLEHNRNHLITKTTPIPYIPEREGHVNLATLRVHLVYSCQQWLEFFNRVLGGSENLIRFVQKAVGYSLTGDTREQCFFLLYGEGDNGKSTFLETLRLLLGDYARQIGFSTFLTQRDDKIWHELARLKGARLVTAVESDAGKKLNEPVVKQITGGDMVTTRFLYKEYFEYKPQFKVWLATNHKPEIRGQDHAIWRRVRLIPFTVKIPKNEQDQDLGSKLYSELPGILDWAVEGCLLWQDEGLEPPAEIKAATDAYRSEMDIVGEFLEERCQLGEGLEARAMDLHKAFSNYCEETGRKERKLSTKNFAVELRERGFTSGRDKYGNYWKGLDLVTATLGV